MPKVKYDDDGNRIGTNPNAYAPDGTPKYVRIYDNGGETADRYMVVFSQTRDGWQHLLTMSGSPFWPQGVCLHDTVESWRQVDRPSYGHLGKKIKFDTLPKDCQKALMQDYVSLWGPFKGSPIGG